MANEKTTDQLLAVLPKDGTALSNKRLQEALGWSKTDYERIRGELVSSRLAKPAVGRGGGLRRVMRVVRDDSEGGVVGEPDLDADDNDETPIDPESAADDSPLLTASSPKERFALQLHREVEGRRDVDGRTYEQALVEYALEFLREDQFDDPVACSYVETDSFSNDVRLRIDGYDLHEDDDDERDIIDLFIVHGASPVEVGADGAPSVRIPTFDGAPVNALFRAARRFVEESRRQLHLELTSDPEARGVARSIKVSKNLVRINLNLITNAEVRQFDRSVEKVDGVEIVKRALDLNSLRRLFSPDEIEVDFSTSSPGGIPCVSLPDQNSTYRSYLAIVPGAFLADLYDRHKQRLLEANVRAYLRAGNNSVNQGIIATIRETPERFFAYNNGITATADELVVETGPDGGSTLVRCRNLQVVNGGQTTASLFHATLRKISLDRVFVPMKINEVIDRARSAEIVQKISFSANRQNKVSLSDFGANMAFHVELQKHSQREVPPVPAPPVKAVANKSPIKPGARWYYERMRGQYQTDLALERTPARMRKFDTAFPKAQVITKTDVARYYMICDQKPFSVCYGAEKNYQRFAMLVAEKMVPDAAWFRALVAKAILVETCDVIVAAQKVPGFKANIVAYTVALYCHVKGKSLDYEAIWRAQAIDQPTREWLLEAIPAVREHITGPTREGKNAGEISKRDECWKQLVTQWNARPR